MSPCDDLADFNAVVLVSLSVFLSALRPSKEGKQVNDINGGIVVVFVVAIAMVVVAAGAGAGDVHVVSFALHPSM